MIPIIIIIRKEGPVTWGAYVPVPGHHPDCTDEDCPGELSLQRVTTGHFGPRRTMQKARKIIVDGLRGAAQKARSEALGG